MSVHDAEDLTQEVFTSVLKGLGNYDHRSKFRSWLRTITINKIRDFIRSSKLRPHAVGGSDAASNLAKIAFPEGPYSSQHEDDDILLEHVLRLMKRGVSQTTWLAFWRTSIDQSPIAVVAEELKISRGAVRQAKHRMLQRLREEFLDLEIQTNEQT